MRRDRRRSPSDPDARRSGVFEVEVGDRHVIMKEQAQSTLVDVEVWGLEACPRGWSRSIKACR
jgi:hypothetical protein